MVDFSYLRTIRESPFFIVFMGLLLGIFLLWLLPAEWAFYIFAGSIFLYTLQAVIRWFLDKAKENDYRWLAEFYWKSVNKSCDALEITPPQPVAIKRVFGSVGTMFPGKAIGATLQYMDRTLVLKEIVDHDDLTEKQKKSLEDFIANKTEQVEVPFWAIKLRCQGQFQTQHDEAVLLCFDDQIAPGCKDTAGDILPNTTIYIRGSPRPVGDFPLYAVLDGAHAGDGHLTAYESQLLWEAHVRSMGRYATSVSMSAKAKESIVDRQEQRADITKFGRGGDPEQ